MGQQAWLCSYLVLQFFTKTKAFVLILFFLKKSVISNLLLYFQWNLFIVAFNHLLLYFLLFKLDLCFSSDIWRRLNKMRSLWLIFAAAWFHFNIIAFGEIWSQIYFRSMMSKDHKLKIKAWKLNTHASKTITIRIKNVEFFLFRWNLKSSKKKISFITHKYR